MLTTIMRMSAGAAGVLVALTLTAAVATAQDQSRREGPSPAPPPFSDFTFKRAAPPASGTRKRITVQIAPAPETPAAPEAAEPAEAEPSNGAFAWFWDNVAPDMGGGPARLVEALELIDGSDGAAAPALDALTVIAAAHGRDILAATAGTQISPALVLAVISVESAGRVDAVSSKGARGIMQLMPDTATRFGVGDVEDAPENIRGGVAYLDWLMGHFDRDPILALAGYNAGEGAVRKHAGVPPFAETRAYVPKVLAAWQVARALCRTPPVLMSDGCVFLTDG